MPHCSHTPNNSIIKIQFLTYNQHEIPNQLTSLNLPILKIQFQLSQLAYQINKPRRKTQGTLQDKSTVAT